MSYWFTLFSVKLLSISHQLIINFSIPPNDSPKFPKHNILWFKIFPTTNEEFYISLRHFLSKMHINAKSKLKGLSFNTPQTLGTQWFPDFFWKILKFTFCSKHSRRHRIIYKYNIYKYNIYKYNIYNNIIYIYNNIIYIIIINI